MAKGINIPIAADTKDFAKGIKAGVIDNLEDLTDVLDDVAKEGDQAGEKLEDSMQEAQKETKELAKEHKALGDVISSEAKKSSRAFAKSHDEGIDGAKEGLQDFKQEANSTAKESAASFDGSAESIVDVFQEISANAFAGFGPAGAVAGLAAAAGIGLAVAGFEATAEAQEASEEAIAGWAEKFIEAGERIIGASQVVAGVTAIATDPEQYKVAAENAKNWGVDVTTAMRAMSGDATSLGVVQETLTARQAEYKEILDETSTSSATSYDKSKALTDAQKELITEVSNGIPAWSKLSGEMEAGADRADTVSRALRGVVDDAASAEFQVDEFGNKLYTLPDETQIIIDAKTGKATQNLETFKGDLSKIPSSKAVVVNGSVHMDTRNLDAALNKSYKITVRGEYLDRQGRRMLI